MAKAPASVTGIDLGRYALKGVVMHRKGGNRFVVSNYGYRALSGPVGTGEQLGKEIKALLKEMGGETKACAIGISSPEAIIRIIEQPDTPPEILREGLRLNGIALLNQDCKEYVLDCDRIPSSEILAPPEPGSVARKRYLVGGLPRNQTNLISEIFRRNGQNAKALQLAPICVFNAFEFALPDIFDNQAFFLVDIGHTTSTMLVGTRKELVLVRQIDFGGTVLLETLMALSGEGRESVLMALDQEDELMIENVRMALTLLTREVGSSIGFFEGRREEVISKIWVSGGVAKSATILQVLSEELRMLCQPWSALDRCEIALTESRQAEFAKERPDFNVACGAAAEVLSF